jgi:hypothetical protein
MNTNVERDLNNIFKERKYDETLNETAQRYLFLITDDYDDDSDQMENYYGLMERTKVRHHYLLTYNYIDVFCWKCLKMKCLLFTNI